MSDSTSSSTLGSLDWPRLMLTRPNWPPVMNAVNGLIDCTTSPDSGSLKVGMGGSFLVSVQDSAGVHRPGDCTCGRAACVGRVEQRETYAAGWTLPGRADITARSQCTKPRRRVMRRNDDFDDLP